MNWPVEETARRRAFRRFVREHHPDRGGDPRVFAAGVASYKAFTPADTCPVVAYRQRWWHLGVTTWVGRKIQRKFRPRVQ